MGAGTKWQSLIWKLKSVLYGVTISCQKLSATDHSDKASPRTFCHVLLTFRLWRELVYLMPLIGASEQNANQIQCLSCDENILKVGSCILSPGSLLMLHSVYSEVCACHVFGLGMNHSMPCPLRHLCMGPKWRIMTVAWRGREATWCIHVSCLSKRWGLSLHIVKRGPWRHSRRTYVVEELVKGLWWTQSLGVRCRAWLMYWQSGLFSELQENAFHSCYNATEFVLRWWQWHIL